MPKRVVITKPSVSYEEGTWHGATEAVNDLLDHTPESYYVQAQATPQHRNMMAELGMGCLITFRIRKKVGHSNVQLGHRRRMVHSKRR